MADLPSMIEKGKRKLRDKQVQMKENYDAKKGQMKTSYNALPFGNRMKRHYSSAIDTAIFHAPDPEKWGRNFEFAARQD